MKVFISWSLPLSELVAKEFSNFLELVIQACDDNFLSGDQLKGGPWFETITKALGDCDIGVVFVTPENMSKEWLNFEAGALLNQFDRRLVCPVVVDMKKTDLKGPMSNLQITDLSDRSDVLRLFTTINTAKGDPLVKPSVLTRTFEREWDHFLERVSKERDRVGSVAQEQDAERTDDDKLDELLERVRDSQALVSRLERRLRRDEYDPRRARPAGKAALLDEGTRRVSSREGKDFVFVDGALVGTMLGKTIGPRGELMVGVKGVDGDELELNVQDIEIRDVPF